MSIFTSCRRRFEIGDMSTVAYLCNADGARSVRDALQSLPAGRAIADRVMVREVYDRAGLWTDETLPAWLTPAEARSASPINQSRGE